MSNYPRHSYSFGEHNNESIVSVKPNSMAFNSTAAFSVDLISEEDVKVTTKAAQRNFSSMQSEDFQISVQPARKIMQNNSEAQSIFDQYSERRKNENNHQGPDPDEVKTVVVQNNPQKDNAPATPSAALGLQFQIDPFTEPSTLGIKDHTTLNTATPELKNVVTSQPSTSLANPSIFFDEMEKTIDGVSSANKMSHQAAVDDFELKLKNMLSGRVPEEYAKKVENETNTTTQTVQSSYAPVKSMLIEKDAGNPHAFFDQIAQARSQARVMDLGTFKANLDFLDSVDQSRALQRQQEKSMDAERIKSRSFAAQKTVSKPLEIPDAVNMTSMDWIEDLAQVTVEPAREALAMNSPEPAASTNTPPIAETIQSNTREQPLLNDQRNGTTICVCADVLNAP